MTQEASLSASLAPAVSRRKVFSLPLLISLIALAAVGGLAWQQNRSLKQLKQNYTQQQALLQTAQDRDRTANEQLQVLQREVALLTAKQVEAQNQQATLSAMYDSVTRTDSQRLLLEAEQALSYASQQLQLSGRVDTALATLNALDSQLQSLNRPELISVRKAIAHDLEALKALPVVDTVSIAAQLDHLIDELDAIPLRIDNQRDPQPQHVTLSEGSPIYRFANEIWGELRQLIQIRRIDRADSVLLTPEQTLLLRENMKLRLLDARSAAIQRNPVIFRADLAAVSQYLHRYFDPQAAKTQQVRTMLQTLSHTNIALAIQDLSTSLYAVRDARSVSDKVKP